jgi:hypothetical protein
MSVRAILGHPGNPQPEMQTPPPEPSLQRLLAIARVDGWSIVIVAALGGLLALGQQRWIECGAALLVGLAGNSELRGRRMLASRDARGLARLIRAQLFLLGIIWIYAWWRWAYFDATAFWTALPELAKSEVDRQLLMAGLEPALDRPLLLEMMNLLTCAVLAAVTLVYQGGLAFYYARQRARVRQALLASPPLVS